MFSLTITKAGRETGKLEFDSYKACLDQISEWLQNMDNIFSAANRIDRKA